MKKILLLIAGLSVFCSYLTASDKQTDGLYTSVLKEYTLHEDGSWTYHHAHKLKLLSYYAFNRRYGETFIVFDTLSQDLRVNRNITTMVSGRKVDAPDNAYNLVLPRYANGAAAYNHLREMVVTHVGIEPGAVIDLDYELVSRADFYPAMMADEILSQDSPIKELTIRVRTPLGKKVHHKLFNSEVQVVQQTEQNTQLYEWKFYNIPAHHHEALQPSEGDLLPRLVFSSAENWEQVKKPFAGPVIGRKLPAQALRALSNESVPPLEQIFAVQKKIVNEMAEFPVPLPAIGYRFRTLQDVWKSNGGTPLEKALLMAGVLNSSGIPSTVVLINSSLKFADTVPSLNQYSDVLVCAKPAGGEQLYLSVHELNQKSLARKFAGHAALVLDGSEGIQNRLPERGEAVNACLLKAYIKMDEDLNVNGRLHLVLEGSANPYLELQRRGGDLKTLFKGYPVDNLQLRELSSDRAEVETSLTEQLDLKSQGDYFFYRINDPAQGISGLNIPTLAITRTYPLSLPADNFKEEFDLVMELPESLSPVSGIADIKQKNAVGEVTIRLKTDGHKLELFRSVQFSKKHISVEEYPHFLELWQIWNNPLYRELVFKKL